MPKKNNRNNKKNKRRKKQKGMDWEEENAILNRNPAPVDIDSFIDKLITHGEASPALSKFLVYTMERQAYGPDLSDEFALFCLSSYFILKDNYDDVGARYELPPKSFLIPEILKHFTFTPGLRDITMELLKVKTEHCKSDSKICVLIIDEQVLSAEITYLEKYGVVGYADEGEEPARFVTTIWLCCVDVKCAFPIAYYFTHDSCAPDLLQKYLFEAIFKLDGIDIDVIGVMVKVKRNLVKLYQNLNISEENVTFEAGKKKIVFIFDVHHLINITRNNFTTYNFHHEDIKTSPKDLGRFFFAEWQFSKKTTITKSHLAPDKLQSANIKYATELLSTNVARTMMSYISSGLMPSSAKGTAYCIDLLDMLFRMMNSTRMNMINPLDSGYFGSKCQVEFMHNMIEFFENLKVYDNLGTDRTNQLIFRKAWIISIKGVMRIWDIMKQKNKPYLLTSNITCEYVDDIYRNLRDPKNHHIDPVPWKFIGVYHFAFVNGYLSYWPYECVAGVGNDFDIDEDYAQKVFKRIPAVSHDLTGLTKVERIFYPELKNTALYFREFVDKWADYCDYMDQLHDDRTLV